MPHSFLKQCLVTFLLSTAMIFSSCLSQNKDYKIGSTVIIEQVEDDYSYTVVENLFKTNKEGERQCDKYFSFKIHEDGFEFISGDLSRAISFLLNVPNSNIIVPEGVENKFFDIHFSGEVNSKNNSEVLSGLLDYYDLRLKEIDIEEDVYHLSISNERKINNYLSNSEETTASVINITGNKCTLKNANLNILAHKLNDIYSENFTADDEANHTYNLNFTIEKSLPATLEYLEEKYGIESQIEKETITKYTLEHKT